MSIQATLESSSSMTNILQQFVNPESRHQQLASKYTIDAAHKVQKSLDKGLFLILDPAERSQSGNRQMRRGSVNEISTEMKNKSARRIDPAEHKRLLRKLAKQQTEMEERRNRILQEMNRKQESELERQEMERRERMNSMMQEKRMMLEEKARLRSEKITQRQEEFKNSIQKLEKVKHDRPLYSVMEEKYTNSILFSSLEERKQKLKQRRELSKPISLSELKAFQKQYLIKKEGLQTQLYEKRASVIVPKYQPPKKSLRLTNILESQLNQKQLKEEEKQRMLNNKLKRSEEYSNILKERFRPQIIQRSATPIVENTRSFKKSRDEKALGNDYLKYSKLKIKRNESSSQLKSTSSMMQGLETKSRASKFSNYLETKDNEYYHQQRQKKLNNIIQSKELSRNQKIESINRETEKLDEVINRKNQLHRFHRDINQETETTEMLLASVKAKIGMLEVFQH